MAVELQETELIASVVVKIRTLGPRNGTPQFCSFYSALKFT